MTHLLPLVHKIEGSVMAALEGAHVYARVENITTRGLESSRGKAVA